MSIKYLKSLLVSAAFILSGHSGWSQPPLPLWTEHGHVPRGRGWSFPGCLLGAAVALKQVPEGKVAWSQPWQGLPASADPQQHHSTVSVGNELYSFFTFYKALHTVFKGNVHTH